MDLVILLVVLGCAIVGVVWGAIRMASLVLAVIAGIFAGRWGGPSAASLFAEGAADPHHRVVAGVIVGVVTAVVVLIAGRGLARGLKALHLSWLDRVAGAVLAGGGAAVILAVILAFAAENGHPPSTPWALGLAGAGHTVLALQTHPASSAMPSRIPPTPTRSGQQPNH